MALSKPELRYQTAFNMKLIFFSIIFFIAGCGWANPFDDQIPYKTRFEDGLVFFEDEKYPKSAQQFKIIVERASHTDLGDDALFFLAESYFLDEEYELALIEYEKLVSRMGFSPYIEKTRWRICETLMALSPNYYHDQESSRKAIVEIQQFLDDYPSSDYSVGADSLIKELRLRLAEKNMETGELYFKLKAYDSAIVAYKIVIKDYYDTTYYKDANLEVMRCLVLLGNNEEAKELLEDLEETNQSLLDDSFMEIASNILNNNS
ncbi:MAG: outer membrane protein assembly factor BamD [Candidatus Neomarinimicrobiota bacterium]|nr:outer membrane protein assembly factor BamD [Candidatus Neomarinimicrobiota bacterium]